MKVKLHLNGGEVERAESGRETGAPSAEEAAAEQRALERAAAEVEDLPPLDEEDIERRAYRAAARTFMAFDRALCAAVAGFNGDREFAWQCALAAKGYWEILGVQDFTQLALRWHCSKENVRKLVDRFQRYTGLPPVPGQRAAEGKRNMSQARKGQLQARTEGDR